MRLAVQSRKLLRVFNPLPDFLRIITQNHGHSCIVIHLLTFTFGIMMSHSFSCVCAIALLSVASVLARPLASIDNTGYSALLNEHVKDGRVNYKAIKQDKRLTDYLEQLSKTDPKTLSGKEELAFWLNVYNAFTLKVMCDHYPLKSITDLNSPGGAGGLIFATIAKSTIWDKQLVEINGKKYSLNGVENDIIRPKGDPRVHFAMVCAAKSCPPLRNEAFQADKLNEQLEDQGRDFIAQSKKNNFDFNKKSCNISNIFNWFKGDFEKTGKTPLQYIARFLPKEQGDMLLANANSFSVNYTEYDWSINE